MNSQDPLPPLIDGYRPDIYAYNRKTNALTIAEAKTDGDIENRHTYRQLSSFLAHLHDKLSPLFIFVVTGCRADHAKVFMRFFPPSIETHVSIAVYDSLDFWRLDRTGPITWHLD